MNKKALITIFVIILTDIIGFGIIIPLLPSISENLNIKGAALGLLTASYALAQFISSPILGNLSDRYGRKPILVLSKGGTIIAYVMLAFSRSYGLILLSRLIDGFTGGNIPAARAYISDVTTKENRARGMAIIGMAFGLGFILGPAIGGIFFSIGKSQTLPALVGAGVSLVSLILTQLFLDESYRKEKRFTETKKFSLKNFLLVFKHPEIQKILGVVFVTTVIMSGMQTTITFFSSNQFGFTPENNSMLFIYLGVLGVIIQGTLARKKITNTKLMIKIGLISSSIGIVLIAVSPNLGILLMAMGLNSFGSSISQIFLPTALSTTSSTDPEGEIMGAYEGVSSLARVVGPAILGSLVLIIPRQAYFACGLTLLVLLLLINNLEKLKKAEAN
ncbi:MAG TPA: MFS transporter [Candidatus Methanoperedens sp.]|nr:MFS transporter [Candidatus Methanoperedens sp.]